MKKIPRIRCPVCGMTCWLNNVKTGKAHEIDAIVMEIGGRGRIKHVLQKCPDGLIDFWIKRLKEVLKRLENLKELKLTIKLPEPSNLALGPVLEKSALQMKGLPSRLQKVAMSNVPKRSQRRSSEATVKLLLKSTQLAKLKVNRK